MMKVALRYASLIVLALSLAAAQQPPMPPGPPGFAQHAGPRVTVRNQTFQSQALGRAMHYRVILPDGYEQSSQRYPVLYLLHGLTGDYTDWESRTHIDQYIARLPIIVVMPDAGNSFYTNSAGEPRDKFEDYVAKDLISDVEKTFRTVSTRHGRAIAGLSMGGYGAMKFALKYPDKFLLGGSFSGAMGAAHEADFKGGWTEEHYRNYDTIYGPPGSKTRSENDVIALAEKAKPEALPFLYVDVGTSDGLLASNREFARMLQLHKISYEYRELPGAHTWDYWDRQVAEFLRLLEREMLRGWPGEGRNWGR